jgi:hypothetical protein
MRSAERVRIDHDALASYPLDPLGAPDTLSVSPEASGRTESSLTEADVVLVLALDAINFGSGYHDVVRKRAGMSGAVTMATSLSEYESTTGPLTADRLTTIGPEDCSQIFGQLADDTSGEKTEARRELMGLFAEALNQLGSFLRDRGSQTPGHSTSGRRSRQPTWPAARVRAKRAEPSCSTISTGSRRSPTTWSRTSFG